ncbi:Zinc finger MYND domain containing protein 15 [Dissostichus eleginoides]|uniref:Zinc finger MYND domain containing protein 15 n=1 Tax=Dissostichus eleginoides TaxID=100907 RepID=A0AAD9F6Z5_DISEL|nr:Zinc finger MYND domain containing protein 15 [Dissostichus eleginoides]
MAPLLSSTLSIYYLITSLLPRQFPEMHILRKQSLRIHIIESYRESQTLVTFWELSVLLPHVTFDLLCVRELLPCCCDKNGRVVLTDCSLPHGGAARGGVRVSFQPAFLQNDSWLSTLPKLQSLRVPTFFCEMSELRCERSDQVMREATGGAMSRPTINPFHCPLRRNGGANRLPRYSNGFIFHLMYKPSANRQPPVMDKPLSDLTSASLSPQRTFRERKAEQHWCREGKNKLNTI